MTSYLEVLGNTSVATIHVCVPQERSWRVRIGLSRVELVLRDSRVQTLAQFPPGITIELARAQQQATVHPGGVSMRIPLLLSDAQRETLANEGKVDVDGDDAKRCASSVQCRRCAASFVTGDTGGQLEVLPMPSLYWAETLEAWMCHGDGLPKQAMEESRSGLLLPRHGTCLSSPVHFVYRIEDTTNLAFDDCAVSLATVRCRRCARVVGESLNPRAGLDNPNSSEAAQSTLPVVGVRLFRHRLRDDASVEAFVARHLADVVRTEVTGKLLVHPERGDGRHHADHAVLLWSFGETSVISSTDPSRMRRALKVRYRVAMQKNEKDAAFTDEFKMWLADMNVRTLPLDVSVCIELATILARRTLDLPPWLRQPREPNMQFSFLEL